MTATWMRSLSVCLDWHFCCGLDTRTAGPARLSPERSSPSYSFWWSRPPSSAGATSGVPRLPGSWSLAAVTRSTSSAGVHVLGFLSSYGREEGFVSGTEFRALAGLATLIALPSSVALIYVAAVAMAFLALVVGNLRQPGPANDTQAPCRDTGLLGAAAMAATTPHHHWYFAWLALPAVVASSRALLWLATAPLLLIEDRPGDRFFWPSLIYVPAILLLLADLRPWLAIKLRRGTENGETPCPL